MASPNNADLMRILKELQRQFTDMREEFNARLTPLEQWKIAVDAATAAIDKYKLDNMPIGNKGQSVLQKELITIIVKLIGVITTILGITYILLQHK